MQGKIRISGCNSTSILSQADSLSLSRDSFFPLFLSLFLLFCSCSKLPRPTPPRCQLWCSLDSAQLCSLAQKKLSTFCYSSACLVNSIAASRGPQSGKTGLRDTLQIVLPDLRRTAYPLLAMVNGWISQTWVMELRAYPETVCNVQWHSLEIVFPSVMW